MTRKVKIMENEKHPLDDLKNVEITEKHSTPTSPSPGNPNTPENLDLDLKAYLMMTQIHWNMKDTLQVYMHTGKQEGSLFPIP